MGRLRVAVSGDMHVCIVPFMDETTEEVDPAVAELVMAIRDRFGLRGLRGAEAMIKVEISLAEQALQELTADQRG